MLFYDCSTAPSPRRARMFIFEKGLEIETRQINLREGEHFDSEFRKVNPNGTVPVLVTDEGEVITENIGIAAYLEAYSPDKPLMGTTPVEKGRVFMWNAIVESQGLMAIAEALRNSNPAMKDRALPGKNNFEQIPALAERGLTRIPLFFDLLDERLKETPYVAGDDFTFADITAFVMVEFSRVVKQGLGEKHEAAAEWHERIKARPSAGV